MLNNTNAQNDIARIKSNYGVCLFELGEHEQSLNMINEALGYITIENDPIFFANTEMMLGIVSLFLLGVKGENMSSFEGILFEGIEAYRKALIVYNLKDYPKKYGSIMLNLARLMLMKEEHYKDGSWLIAKHYYDNILLESLGSGLSEARKEYDVIGKRLIEMTTNTHIKR